MLTTVMQSLMIGFGETLKIFFCTLLGALPLGLVVAFGSMCRFRPVRALMRTLVWVVRGTPLMLQLIVIFYGPGLLGNNIWGTGSSGRMAATLVAFIVNYACYFSEIYRGGIESIPAGQYEAGQVLGMTKRQIFSRIILLQVVKRIVPPISNEIITLVKDTSLSRIIAIQEIIYYGEKFIKNGGILWPLLFTGVFYLVFSGLLTLGLGRLEKRLNYFQ